MLDWLIKPNAIPAHLMADFYTKDMNDDQQGLASRLINEIADKLDNTEELVFSFSIDIFNELKPQQIGEALRYVRSWFWHEFDGIAINFSNNNRKVTVRR